MLCLEMNPSCLRKPTATKQQCRSTGTEKSSTSNVKNQPSMKRMLCSIPSVFNIRWAST